MRSVLFLLLFLLLAAASCKKDPEKSYSYWYVNADSFSSNSAATEVASGILSLSSHAPNNFNSFRISFKGASSLPVSGTYRIRPVADTTDVVAFDCWYKGKYYRASAHTSRKLSPKMMNGKALYVLEPTWCTSFNDPGDSVSIKGNFMEP